MSNKAFVSLCSACGQGFAEDNTEVGRPRLTKCNCLDQHEGPFLPRVAPPQKATPQVQAPGYIYPDHNRISAIWSRIVQGRLLKDGRKWTLGDSADWPNAVSVLYNRECYDQLIERFRGKRNILITGTPGIGKSMFLMAFLVHLVEQRPPTGIPTINYKYMVDKFQSKELRLLADGHVQRYDERIHSLPEYLLSDGIDIFVASGTIMNLLVASGQDSNYNKFSKRICEVGIRGSIESMPLFTYDELLCIKPQYLSYEESLFIYDIFGGNARNFKCFATHGAKNELVEKAMVLFFGVEKSLEHPAIWNSALITISRQFAMTATINMVNSLMIHIAVDSAGIDEVVWASPFMKFLAGMIVDAKDADMQTALQSVIQNSGVGMLFESIGHKKLITSDSEYKLKELQTTYSHEEGLKILISVPRQVVLIRRLEDIYLLPNNTYGLPTISNYSLVDAIIQPDILINFTVDPNGHKGATDKLEAIREQLRERDKNKHKMVFVIPTSSRETFKYQVGLGDIKQFICFPDPSVTFETLMTPAERQRLKNQKKRKRHQENKRNKGNPRTHE